MLSLLVTGCGNNHAASNARASAEIFLQRYVQPDGRVVRIDQGGDTVSEGQAYAMLLDVATRNQAQFASVWDWSRENLSDTDGLLAYHWQNGRIADHSSASDADLDIARALVLAGSEWHNRTWTAEGAKYATAIVNNETATFGGQLWLLAGPWARTNNPHYLDPSYFDPGAFELFTSVTHDPRWARLATSSAAALTADTHNGTQLPSDWATVSSAGKVEASAPPAGGAMVYGYDAFRVLIRGADGCRVTPVRQLDSDLFPLAQKTASSSDRADTYNTNGTPSESGYNPLMLIAAAGSASASGDDKARNTYLDEAATVEPSQQTYYLDAWVALGRYYLTTSALSGCKL
jgi:endo-1,4-beta-D-glucanase Y